MGFFSSAPAPAADPAADKPLPDPLAITNRRPGTSGTELNLRMERTKAQTSYQRAQRAEAAYRAKRQARNARTDIAAAKSHTRETFKHLGLALGSSWRVFKGVPGVIKEKDENMKAKLEVRKKEKAAEDKKRLEEKLKKQQERAAEEEAAAAAEPAAEEPAAAEEEAAA